MFAKKCIICGKTYSTPKYTSRFCCARCYNIYRRTEKNKKLLEDIRNFDSDSGAFLKDGFIYYRRVCQNCGREFDSRSYKGKYCCLKCHDEHSAKRAEALRMRKRQRLEKIDGLMEARKERQEEKERMALKKEQERQRLQAILAEQPPVQTGSNVRIKKICACCGKEFFAFKKTTMFCSTSCARDFRRRQPAEERDIPAPLVASTSEASYQQKYNKDYLRVRDAAELLSVSTRTVFRYVTQHMFETVKLSGVTLVRKQDLERFMAEKKFIAPPQPSAPAVVVKTNPILESRQKYLTINEAAEAYGMDRVYVTNLLRHSDIPFVRFKNVRFYLQDDIDAFLIQKKKGQHEEITEWYDIDETMSLLGMTNKVSVYNLMTKKKVPKKRVRKHVYYSKRAVDRLVVPASDQEWYTVQDIAERYGINEDRIFHVFSRFKIRKVRKGRLMLYNREDVDDLMATK